ncbi:MAG: divalent metal cation transporter [Holophagales bacterium]|nr:divalent metal cation transporter [Holophagales bacterium]MYD21937.1 divalent metal cation transporter [Holophagales bacterium]MYI31865.1 divalent metal cation transporter [Holophagales bacterium]
MASSACVEQRSDPYTVREGGAVPPPANWRNRIRYLGPSIVISGAIVGSGEIILTSALGAAAGFVLLWWVLLSCWIKSLIQAELARYTLVSGDTYVRAMNRLPFRIRIGRGHVSFAVAITLIALVPGLLGMGGIIGGAGQALTLLVPEVPSTLAAGLLAVITIAVLTTGSYRILENVMLALVMIFTGATLVCAILMQGTEFAVTRADLASGFTFSFPPEFIVAAMAVYGYSGVNSAETSAYQYWCVEKGYPNFIGRSDAPGWETRARGWIRVMQTDVWVTLVLLTCATVPFYMLGAGVLKKLGKEPDGLETISMLSEMFTQTLGPWSLWLFGVGAFCILFSTMISFIAGEARYIPDYIMELGYLKRRNLAARRLWIRGYCAAVPIFCFIVYMWIQNPRLLITISSLVAGMLLPIQSGAVLWLQRKRMDPRIRPGRGIRTGIWAIFLIELTLVGFVIRYVVLEPLLN